MGYRAARRKLRIGKLRPRTVASLIAIITGILISIVTYGVVLLVWADFREALTMYQSTRADRDKLRAEREQIERDIDAMEIQLKTASADLEQAIKERTAALTEKSEADKQLTDTRGQLVASAIELDKQNREVSSLRQQERRLENKISALQKDIESLEGYEVVEGDLRDVLEQAVEEFEEGEIVLAKGDRLIYHRIPGGTGDIAGELGRAVNKTLISLERRGLRLSETATEAAQSYAENYPHRGDPDGSVVIVSTAKNVIAGQDVELAFTSISLAPLISSGAEVMKIELSGNTARVNMLGGVTRNIDVPEQFDAAGVVSFADDLKEIFEQGMEQLGFLAAPRGGYTIPGADINSIGDLLIDRPRPLVVRLIASGPYNALDGVPDITVQVNGQ